MNATIRRPWIACLALAAGSCSPAAAEPPREPPRELARWFASQSWQRDTAGPIVSLGAPGRFDDMHIFAPAVVREDDRFLLWYSGSRGTPGNRVFRLGLATSGDGKRFEPQRDNPVLEFKDGKRSVLTPALLRRGDGAVLREDGKLRMWFSSAWLGKAPLHTLHESTSADGIHWTEPSSALMDNAYCPSVLKTERGYEMWYSDVSKRPWVIRHAVSADGRKWAVTPRPVLQLSQEWEAEVLVYPTVLKIDDAYLMWYGSYYTSIRRERTAIGFAASLDGVTWHKHPQNPVLRPDPGRPWESNYVGSGCVARLDDGTFRYWYASRKEPPFLNLYFAINTARWAGPPVPKQADADSPEPIRAYLRRCEDAKAAALKVMEEEIASLRASNPTGAAAKRLQAVEAQLKRLRGQPAPLLRLPLPPSKGDVGILGTADARRTGLPDVLEVVDKANAIVRTWLAADASSRAAVEDPTFVDLWVQGIDTAGLAAGAGARLPQVFQVVGNRLFDTTCGKRSLPLLEPVDVEPYREIGRK